MRSLGRQLFETLCEEIERLHVAHPDRAIIVAERTPSVAVSNMSRGPLTRTSLLQSLCLHADGTIWFNVVPGARERSTGLWSASTMRLGVTDQPRAELAGIAPERVQISEV